MEEVCYARCDRSLSRVEIRNCGRGLDVRCPHFQFSGAQNYPVKPVRYIVPFPAGTSNDIVGRLLADQLTRKWGQQVVVENRVGASGTIGAAFVAKSAARRPLQRCLHCNIAPNAISPRSMSAKLPYRHKDFRAGHAASHAAQHRHGCTRRRRSKAIKDMWPYAKAKPGLN
jgi:tripartite-type tricarboxylate transporter receptor subunit TctC